MRAVVLLLAAGCTSASPDPGLDSLFQVANAQYRPGPFPGDGGGPAALALATRHASVTIGTLKEKATGTLAPGARAAVFGVDGVDGTWLVKANPPDLSAPDDPTADAVFGLASTYVAGDLTLRVAASDALGRFGSSASVVLHADDPILDGELIVGLSWTGSADLDLHVIEPGAGEAWSDKPNTMLPPVPGVPVDPLEYQKHGILDHDGNKDCHRDGAPNEHVIWQLPPPPGEYVVRVDARSMCAAPVAEWTIAVSRNGALLETVHGIVTPADVLQQHGAGAGVLALRFTL